MAFDGRLALSELTTISRGSVNPHLSLSKRKEAGGESLGSLLRLERNSRLLRKQRCLRQNSNAELCAMKISILAL